MSVQATIFVHWWYYKILINLMLFFVPRLHNEIRVDLDTLFCKWYYVTCLHLLLANGILLHTSSANHNVIIVLVKKTATWWISMTSLCWTLGENSFMQSTLYIRIIICSCFWVGRITKSHSNAKETNKAATKRLGRPEQMEYFWLWVAIIWLWIYLLLFWCRFSFFFWIGHAPSA
jgi:hypothetical protein